MLRTTPGNFRKIIAFQDVEHLERSDALTIWRQLPDIVTAIVGRDWFYPGTGMIRQVFITEIAPYFFKECIDGSCDLSFVKNIPTTFSDFLKCIGQVGIFKDISFFRHFTIGVIMFFDIGILTIDTGYGPQ